MNGLPKDTDFSTLLGREVTMVRIGKFQLHYFLNQDKPNRPDAWIEIESDEVIFTDAEGNSARIADFRTGAGSLCLLLGLTVEDASRREDGGLKLKMSSGIQLEVGVHTPIYESVVLHIGDKAIVG